MNELAALLERLGTVLKVFCGLALAAFLTVLLVALHNAMGGPWLAAAAALIVAVLSWHRRWTQTQRQQAEAMRQFGAAKQHRGGADRPW